MVITSLTNAKVTEAVKLSDKKYRKEYGKYVLEGARAVNDAFKYGADILSVFVKESVERKYDFDGKLVVSDRVFEKMCDTVNNQGVLAVVRMPKKTAARPCGNCLVLDGLQDPGNVGTLIRTAVACGFTDLIASNSVDLYSPKVLRSCMSAHFCINLCETENIAQAFELIKECQTVVADMGGQNVFSAEFNGKVALIVGNEGNGVSEFSKQNADMTVSLPMENGFESLNVSVAGSVIMYQIYSKQI